MNAHQPAPHAPSLVVCIAHSAPARLAISAGVKGYHTQLLLLRVQAAPPSTSRLPTHTASTPPASTSAAGSNDSSTHPRQVAGRLSRRGACLTPHIWGAGPGRSGRASPAICCS
jgi:hypothetical protein